MNVSVCVCVCHFGMQKKRNLANELLSMRSVGSRYFAERRKVCNGRRIEDSLLARSLALSLSLSLCRHVKGLPNTAKYADGISKLLSARLPLLTIKSEQTKTK